MSKQTIYLLGSDANKISRVGNVGEELVGVKANKQAVFLSPALPVLLKRSDWFETGVN